MKQITIKAPAKINLFLNITGVRPDGYHELQTVMQAIDLYDTLTVSLTDTPGITLCCSKGVPSDESNIAWRCAKALLDDASLPGTGIHIAIDKQIPIQAGLGGGSTDGAAVLTALNMILNLNLPLERLTQIGKTIGADIPFCLLGSTALAEGIGEKLTRVSFISPCSLAIVKPSFGISTREAFAQYDSLSCKIPIPPLESLLEALRSKSITNVSDSLFNVLEHCAKDIRVEQIKRELLFHGALGAMMTGSGSAVFGIFKTEEQVQSAFRKISPTLGSFYLCHPVDHGSIPVG